MLHVQRYLQGGKNHDDLRQELGIRIVRHPEEPLVILNYDQIDSPRSHPVARECRGLVLHAETHDLVARSFPRFFNWGEMTEEMKQFDFSDFVVQTKEDGSLVLLFHHAGHWRLTTRGSFAQDLMRDQTFTWGEGILQTLGVADLDELADRLDPTVTYVCEWCSPYNTVIRSYPVPRLYLLSAFRGAVELSPDEVDALVREPLVRPARHRFGSVEEIRAFLRAQASADPTYEGVVMRDRNAQRWKIKSATYLGLHHLDTEGENAFAPKHILPFILAGETSELLAYYPQLRPTCEEMQARADTAFAVLESVWRTAKDIAEQKAFAQAIQGKTPFTGVLFSLRKMHGAAQTREHLRAAWLDAEELILKSLFERSRRA